MQTAVHPHRSAPTSTFTSCAGKPTHKLPAATHHPPVSGDTRFCSALILMAELMRCAASAAQLLLLLPMFQSLQTGGKEDNSVVSCASPLQPAGQHLLHACAGMWCQR